MKIKLTTENKLKMIEYSKEIHSSEESTNSLLKTYKHLPNCDEFEKRWRYILFPIIFKKSIDVDMIDGLFRHYYDDNRFKKLPEEQLLKEVSIYLLIR